MEEQYWKEFRNKIVGPLGPEQYRNQIDALNATINIAAIVDRFVDSDPAKDNFEIESSEDNILVRLQRARCFMFIQCFKRFFGTGQRQRLVDEMQWFDLLPIYAKFLSPHDLEKEWIHRYKRQPLTPVLQLPQAGAPKEKFCWALKYDMPGKFLWNTGMSATFGDWLEAGKNQDIVSCGMINCWEMVFYAAIRSGLLGFDTVNKAYSEAVEFGEIFYSHMVRCVIVGDQVMTPDTAPAKSAEELDKWADEADEKREYKFSNLKSYALELGDIVVVDNFLEDKSSWLSVRDQDGKFTHVAAVIEKGPKADILENIKVTSLWESPPTTAIHPIKPILATMKRDTEKPGTKLVRWFWIIRL